MTGDMNGVRLPAVQRLFSALPCRQLPGFHFFPHCPLSHFLCVLFSFFLFCVFVCYFPPPIASTVVLILMWGEAPPPAPDSVTQLSDDEPLEVNFYDDTSQAYRRCLRAHCWILVCPNYTARSLLTARCVKTCSTFRKVFSFTLTLRF
jgi:hypothetical protein